MLSTVEFELQFHSGGRWGTVRIGSYRELREIRKSLSDITDLILRIQAIVP